MTVNEKPASFAINKIVSRDCEIFTLHTEPRPSAGRHIAS